jgi:hypothetical protein
VMSEPGTGDARLIWQQHVDVVLDERRDHYSACSGSHSLYPTRFILNNLSVVGPKVEYSADLTTRAGSS